MPIVRISSTPSLDSSRISELMKQVRKVGASTLKTTTDNIWVTFESISHSLIAEKPMAIVLIMAQSGRPDRDRTDFVQAVSSALGEALAIPAADVWIHYEEIRPEDVWFHNAWSGK